MTEDKIKEGVSRNARRICHWLYNRRPDILDTIFAELWGEEIIVPEDVTSNVMLKGTSVDVDDILGTKLELIMSSIKEKKSRDTLKILIDRTVQLPGLQASAKKAIHDRNEKSFSDVELKNPIVASISSIYSYLNYPMEPWLSDYFLSASPMTDEDSQDDVAREIDLGNSFRECSVVKCYTDVLKEKMAEAAEVSSEQLIKAMSGTMTDSPCFDINDLIGRCMNEIGANPYVPPDDYGIRKQCHKIYSEATNSVCRQFIYDVICEVFADSTEKVIPVSEKKKVSIITEDKNKTRIKTMAALKRKCNAADGMELLTNAMWNANIRLNMYYLFPTLRKRFLDSMSEDKKAKETKESRLKRNFNKAEKEYRQQIAQYKKENNALLQKNDKLKKINDDFLFKSDIHENSSKKDRTKEEKKLKKLYQELDKKEEIITALQEKMKTMENASSGEKNIEIPRGKFMFVVSEDHLKMRLKSWFPDCVISEKSSVVSKKLDLIIFLCKSLKHEEYYRIKNKCKSMNIPFVHCNHASYQMICQTISECLKENQGMEREEE